MADKRYYWLKLPEDFFSPKNKPISRLRRMAGGDTYTIIYLKLLLNTMNNDGKIYYEGIEDTFAEEIAYEIGEEKDNVLATLSILTKLGLAVISENEAFFPESGLMTGSETASAKRMRLMRERTKAIQEDTKASLCYTDVTDCYTEREKERETEEETEKEGEKREERTSFNKDVCSTGVPRKDIESVLSAWNSISSLGIPAVKSISSGTKRHDMLVARIKQYGIDDVLEAIAKASESDFLLGKTPQAFKFTFDWFVKPNNFLKVLEGNYDNRQQTIAPDVPDRYKHIFSFVENNKENDSDEVGGFW